jgi:cysteine desulfurase
VSAAAVYLDHHATTPVDETVFEAMLPFLRARAANPSSPHAAGRSAHAAVERARERIGQLVGARPGEVILTAGATEASNLAIRGLRVGGDRTKVVTSGIEHPSTLEPIRRLGASGAEVVIVPVGPDGRVDREALAEVIDARTALVSIGAANGEIGVIQDLAAISEIVHRHGAMLHSDAAQAVLSQAIDCHELEIDLLSISAHKLYGPQGVGALIARGPARELLEPIMYGGGQENGLRSGTTNVAGAVGFGAAAVLAAEERGPAARRMATLRDTLAERLEQELGATVNGSRTHRLAANLNVRIPGVEADALIASCPEVQFSAGSACSAGSPGPSPVLTAIGLSPTEADECVRFGLGRATNGEEIARAGTAVINAARRILAGRVAVGAAA